MRQVGFRLRPALRADLDRHIVLLYRGDHCLAFLDGAAGRLFAVDVLAGFGGVNDLDAVLKDLGLVESIRGDYSLIREVRVGVLKQFVSVGGVMLPRYLFYAVLVTTMLATFLLQNPFRATEQYITTVIFGLVPLVILWYETFRLWRDKPR